MAHELPRFHSQANHSCLDSFPLGCTSSKLKRTCCVWGCGCTEKQEHQDVGTEACPANRTPSGPPPADCASCLSSLPRTLQQDGNNCQHGVVLGHVCAFALLTRGYILAVTIANKCPQQRGDP